MKNNNQKNILKAFGAWLKEKIRKILVALKKNPQSIPLIALCAAFGTYSFNLTNISKTVERIYGAHMGLASFISMLFMILSFVCMLNAFPKRQKPKLLMIIIMMVLYAGVIIGDIHVLSCIINALYRPEGAIVITVDNMFIAEAYNTLIVNIVLIGLTVICVILEPLFAKLIKKINTSIEVEAGQNIDVIEISNED